MGMNNDDCKCTKCGGVSEEIALRVDLGRVGYESKFDGSFVIFNVCGDCLLKFHNTSKLRYFHPDHSIITFREYDDFLYALVKSFPLEQQEPIFNSGSNTYLSSVDWIRYEKGEMSDIEKLEMGLSV